MSFSDDPTSPTKKKRVRSNHEPRESPQDYSFLLSSETEKEIMNQQLLEMSRFSVSSRNRDKEAFKSRHGSSLINPNYFETEKQIMSQEPHETSRFSVSPMNRDEEAFKNQHGSFSETTNYSERSLNSTGNNNDQSYLDLEASNNSLGHRTGTQLQMSNTSVIGVDSGEGYGTNYPDSIADKSKFFLGSGGNKASMSSERDNLRPKTQPKMSYVSNSSINSSVGMYAKRIESKIFQEANLQRLGTPGEGYDIDNSDSFGSGRNIASIRSQRDDFRPEKQHTMSNVSNSSITDGVGMYTRKLPGEGYGTTNLYTFKDQRNLYFGSGGNMASTSSQSNRYQNAKVSNPGIFNIRPEMQQKMFTSSISGPVGMNAKSVDSLTNLNPQHGHDNSQRSGNIADQNVNISTNGNRNDGQSYLSVEASNNSGNLYNAVTSPSCEPVSSTSSPLQFQQQQQHEWTSTKILSRTDVGKDIWRLVLTKHFVEQNIPNNMISEALEKETTDITFYDHDTNTTHKLCLVFKNRYFLKGCWTKDFMIRRNLKAGDKIGLFWDSYASRLQFSVISRAKTKAPAGNKKPSIQ